MPARTNYLDQAFSGLVESLRRNADIQRGAANQELNIAVGDRARALNEGLQTAREERSRGFAREMATASEERANREFARNEKQHMRDTYLAGADNAYTNARTAAIQSAYAKLAEYDRVLAASLGQPNMLQLLSGLSQQAGGQPAAAKADAAKICALAGPLANLNDPRVRQAIKDRNAALDAIEGQADAAGLMARNRFIQRNSDAVKKYGLTDELKLQEIPEAPNLPAPTAFLDALADTHGGPDTNLAAQEAGAAPAAAEPGAPAPFRTMRELAAAQPAAENARRAAEEQALQQAIRGTAGSPAGEELGLNPEHFRGPRDQATSPLEEALNYTLAGEGLTPGAIAGIVQGYQRSLGHPDMQELARTNPDLARSFVERDLHRLTSGIRGNFQDPGNPELPAEQRARIREASPMTNPENFDRWADISRAAAQHLSHQDMQVFETPEGQQALQEIGRKYRLRHSVAIYKQGLPPVQADKAAEEQLASELIQEATRRRARSVMTESEIAQPGVSPP